MIAIGTDIVWAKQILDEGRLVAIPTETVYGLAGNALNEAAVLRIFEAKNRPAFDPLIVHIDTVDKLEAFTLNIPDTAIQLFSRFSPGPLTILLPKNHLISDLVTSGSPFVAVRIPAHPLALSLLKSVDYPLAAPSANPFGYISPTTAAHVADQLGDKIPYVLDGGPCVIGVESTIVRVDAPDRVTVLRKGGVTIEDLENTGLTIQIMSSGSSKPHAPGMLESHYAPRKPFIVGTLEQLIKHYPEKKVGILSFKDSYEGFNHYILSPSGNLGEAARNLFTFMRELDKEDVDLIIAETVPDFGIGTAINDRLQRASMVK